MKRYTILASLLLLVGFIVFFRPDVNASAFTVNNQVRTANHATYRTVDYDDYYHGYDPYYTPYVYQPYYYGPGFYVNTPFFGFNFGF
jgi:hypothetical protein